MSAAAVTSLKSVLSVHHYIGVVLVLVGTF